MNKKFITILIAFTLFIGYPMADVFAATTTTSSTSSSKPATKIVKKNILCGWRNTAHKRYPNMLETT